ncbi:thioredoxin [Candidatus Woesearchaeota archaeon]|nr:thioredoxin [Candidatus Woesearchaeota archaeon]
MEISGDEFEEKVIKQSKKMPVVVDFFADWCVPCGILGPVLEKIAIENEGKFVLVKLDIDKNPDISKKYAVTAVPAVKLFKDGNVVNEFIGVLPEASIREWLKKNL